MYFWRHQNHTKTMHDRWGIKQTALYLITNSPTTRCANVSKDEYQIGSDIDSENDSPATIDIEHLLKEITRQISGDSSAESVACKGILSELSYSFEGIGWHLQPLNEDPPIEIGINGIQGKRIVFML